MLNVAQIQEQLELRYGSIADVDLQYMENKTVARQARLWSGASLVIHLHGASLGNYAFLPRKAAAIHISLAGRGPAGQGDAFPQDFVCGAGRAGRRGRLACWGGACWRGPCKVTPLPLLFLGMTSAVIGGTSVIA